MKCKLFLFRITWVVLRMLTSSYVNLNLFIIMAQVLLFDWADGVEIMLVLLTLHTLVSSVHQVYAILALVVSRTLY